jgi:hypothetical protein
VVNIPTFHCLEHLAISLLTFHSPPRFFGIMPWSHRKS